ncbi:hypothetical protein LY90DRAFT_509410 [Neocallimastix californiae]|uniref:Uncharacterized protein n=1 Tax=Neocallimastix californiae TaxID=1754190 RepID=A0A1Y2CFF3_9FUNG|nr:hypothetical protein LY90DRAFT_509410 [Neocallimastix californiae]|eukprot:ORY45798.1 hypothetical protein LY90DRAFT_509410 [Neocallimastix californiae]
MNCGDCLKKNYNNDKPLSKRIFHVILVFFVVWQIGFSHLAQAFFFPKKQENKKPDKKPDYKKDFLEKIVIVHVTKTSFVFDFLIGVILFLYKIIRMLIKKAKSFIQNNRYIMKILYNNNNNNNNNNINNTNNNN